MGRSRSNHYVLPCKVKLVKTRMKWRKVNGTESKMMRKQRYKQDYGRVLYTTMEWGEWGVGEISKFADDTKFAILVNTLSDIRSIQRTLDKLVSWANRWDMEFNVTKCGVMHIGKRNLEFQYQMNDGWVKLVDEKKGSWSVNI